MSEEKEYKKVVGIRQDGTPIYVDSLDFKKKNDIVSQTIKIDKKISK